MEYLMTYGWSILIIAIVLAALFSLGVFSNANLGPRAQPNSCRVFRPGGPGTTTNINLEGTCNGELPEYVAELNGGTSSILTPVVSTATTGVTMSIWVDILSSTPGEQNVFYNGNFYGGYGLVLASSGCYGTGLIVSIYLSNVNCNVGGGTNTISQNQWSFLTLTVTSGNVWTSYINGVPSGSGSAGARAPQAWTGIGSAMYTFSNTLQPYSVNGLLANAQFYNVALDSNAIQALYLEGIGGAPVEPQNLVAWWPLNGDTNDYSGNGNNAGTANVIFTESWTSGYTTP